MTPDELRRIADALLRLDTLAAHITDDYLAAEIRQAQASLLHRCEVQAECLAYAINNNEKTGVWGGRSERARRAIRRRAFGGAA